MRIDTTKNSVEKLWNESVIPALSEYIKIPCKSPSFDKDWDKNGYIEDAVKLMNDSCDQQSIKGLTSEIVRID